MSKTTQFKSPQQRHPWCGGKAWKNGVGMDESARHGEWAWPSHGHLGACTQCHTGPSLAWCPGARSNLRPNLGMNSSIPGLRAGASKTRICQSILGCPTPWPTPPRKSHFRSHFLFLPQIICCVLFSQAQKWFLWCFHTVIKPGSCQLLPKHK